MLAAPAEVFARYAGDRDVGRYMAWRLHTAYGDPEATPPLEELERYLRWAAKLRAMNGRDGRGGAA